MPAVINSGRPPSAGGPLAAAGSSQPPATAPGWYPASTGPAPKAPLRRRLLIAVAAIVAAVIAAGTGFTAVMVLRDRLSPAAQAPTPAGPALRDLERYLLPAPAGAAPWPGEPPTESIDLAQADDLALGQTDWGRQLADNGFVGGVVRRWVDGDGQQVELALLQVADATSSWKTYETVVNFCTTVGDVWESEGQKVGELFVTRYPDARGYRAQLGVNYAGDVVIKILISGKGSVVQVAADQMLQDQSAALGS